MSSDLKKLRCLIKELAKIHGVDAKSVCATRVPFFNFLAFILAKYQKDSICNDHRRRVLSQRPDDDVFTSKALAPQTQPTSDDGLLHKGMNVINIDRGNRFQDSSGDLPFSLAMNFDNLDFGFSNRKPGSEFIMPNSPTTFTMPYNMPTTFTMPTPIPTPTPPFYFVIASDKVRPFSDFEVAVTVVGTSQPVTVTVGMYGTEKDNPFVRKSIVTVDPNTTQITKIRIKELKPDEYHLGVQGDDHFKFEAQTALNYVEKFQSIFVQTDKAMYKPGHLVNFRVLVLDSRLKPSLVNKIDVMLKDAQNNRVKEWKKVDVVKGMFSNEIQLSSNPVLGDWSIVVKTNGKEHVKKFTVAEYVLPKFEVIVDVPQHATYDSSTVPVSISAKYTFGLPVKGEATIKVRPHYTFFKEDIQENSKVISVVTVGKTKIDIVKALKLETNQYYERTILFEVAFKEEVTGKVLNGSASLKLHHAKCRVDFQKITDCLTPGDIYRTLLKISSWEDTPFAGPKNTPVRVRYGKGWVDRENATWKEYQLPPTGVLELNFETESTTEVLNIEAEYLGVTAYETVVKKQLEDSKNSSTLDLVILNDKPKIGDLVEIEVFTKGEASFLTYLVISRNELAEGKTMIFAEGQTSLRLKFRVTQSMAPESHIIMLYISNKGEIVAAEKEIKIENVFPNFVKMSATPKEIEPGKEVNITIESKPNSIVGLMGVDQSVNLLKKGNDISREDVENDLHGYDNMWYGGGGTGIRPGGKRSTVGYVAGYSARDIFSRAGSVIVTNAYLPEEKLFGSLSSSTGGRTSAPTLASTSKGSVRENSSLRSLSKYARRVHHEGRNMSVRSKSMGSRKSDLRPSVSRVLRTYSSDRVGPPMVIAHSNVLETWIWESFEQRSDKDAAFWFSSSRPNEDGTTKCSAFTQQKTSTTTKSHCSTRGSAFSVSRNLDLELRGFRNPTNDIVERDWKRKSGKVDLRLLLQETTLSQGKTSIRRVVPDTITSWVITGFSLNPENGLGLSEDPTQVRVFRPFFISLNLPYSVTREETMLLPVYVFNYMDKELKVEVNLENPGWFTFPVKASLVAVSNQSSQGPKKKKPDSESVRTKTVVVASNSSASVNFVITPKQIGYLEVKVTARSALAGDGVSRKLLVKPEGEIQYRSKGILVDLRNKKEFSEDVELDIPNDIVPDSQLIEVSVVGDLLASVLENLDKLIRQPYGCGEQNMLNFVPNLVILDYLKNTSQLTNTIQQKALKYLELGYQRELTYKHKDNSFSAFGENDRSGSTWLTAFVAKSFKQAQKVIDIENSAIIEPLRWIAAKQNRNGSFPEVGQVWHKDMQGGGSNGLALTAYVLTAFVESTSTTDEFKENIDRAARFINEQIDKGNIDTYSLAVTSYALMLAGHPLREKAFQLLASRSKIEGGMKWWEKDKVKEKDSEANINPWDTCIPNAINVEVTAYAMLSYLHKNMNTEAIPILRWLLTQQNREGGFASTQDTVVALGSISKLAKKMASKNNDMSIAFEYPPEGSTKLKLNQDNALVLQKAELTSKKVRHIAIDAKGTGLGIVQISYRYNIDKKGVFPLFNLAPQVDANSTRDHLILSVSVCYTGGKESNMAVMEVTLPTGFTIDDEGIRTLKMSDKVRKVETKDEETVVILYFDKVTSETLCPTISAYKSFKIAKQRPVPVTIYDYYDNSRRATEFYSPKPTEICDLCEADDCTHCDIKA